MSTSMDTAPEVRRGPKPVNAWVAEFRRLPEAQQKRLIESGIYLDQTLSPDPDFRKLIVALEDAILKAKLDKDQKLQLRLIAEYRPHDLFAAIFDNLEVVLKRFRRKVIRSGLFKDMKKRRYYEKPSQVRKRKAAAAARRRRARSTREHRR